MSEPHHSDVIEDNIETHPVKVAIGVAIGAVALIAAIILLAQFAIGAYGSRSLKDDPSMATDAVAKRLAPVANLAIDPNAPAPPPSPAPGAPAAAPAVAAIPPPSKAAAGAAPGKATYETVCAACHGAGVAGAPKFADKGAWAARVKEGKEHLYASALKGKGAMPPKGGNPALPDADVKAAVDYLLAAVK